MDVAAGTFRARIIKTYLAISSMDAIKHIPRLNFPDRASKDEPARMG